jgi:4a-hydroxytetrahydrobiopterin dehydratase
MSTLSREEIARRLPSLQGWSLDGNAIKKQYTFRDFPDAVRFVDRLVPVAEAADHHPDILINYKRVTLTYSTHSEGGLTEGFRRSRRSRRRQARCD